MWCPQVFRGLLWGQKVAIKQLKTDKEGADAESLERELRHESIVEVEVLLLLLLLVLVRPFLLGRRGNEGRWRRLEDDHLARLDASAVAPSCRRASSSRGWGRWGSGVVPSELSVLCEDSRREKLAPIIHLSPKHAPNATSTHARPVCGMTTR